MYAVGFALIQLLQPYLDNQPTNWLTTAQLGWALFVLVAVFAFHFRVASADRAAVGEEGASSTLRRWYMYAALLLGLLTILARGAMVVELGWTQLVVASIAKYSYLSPYAGRALPV